MIVDSPIGAAVVPRTRIVLAGHPFAPIGMGEHIRCSFRAFQSVGSNVGLKDIYGLQDPDPDLKKELQDSLAQDFSGDINIFHINGDEIDAALSHPGTALPKDAYNVVYPMWELSRYPKEWADQLNRFDEIWAPSKFTYDSIAPAVAKPVVHMPQTGQISVKNFLGRRHFKIPESAFTFLFFFDFTSYLQRKNPFAVLQAFEKLCSLRPAEDFCLVIKVKGGESRSEDYQTFCDYVARSKGRFIVIDQLLSDNEIKNLVRCCDSFISLHRSEGFGLGLINAMFLGKPVIGTAYSANMDFMTDSNSCLVRYKLCQVPQGAYPFAEGQVWADADIDHAVEHMLKLSCERDCARALGREASRHIRVNFSYRATGLRYGDRIAEIIRNRASLRKAQT
jgi:glycosyltransferase involved in cell wall biosynthesis